MDFKKLSMRFKQFGSCRLLWEYAKLGVLWTGLKAFFRCLVKRESFKSIYPEILCKIEPYLEQRYAPVVSSCKFLDEPSGRAERQVSSELEHKRGKIIWFCWLQGMEDAPAIVRVCYNSLERHLVKVKDYRLKVIDNSNWSQFVELPEYVVRKWEKGRIPAANFSDLLRLELLIKYGGTWVDSTVLCTGDVKVNGERLKVKEYLDADLFLFQYTPEGTTKGISISNWFITACTNNVVLMAVRDMLYAYWKDYDCILDYYMFHLFFEMAAREYPEEVGAMPYGSSQGSIALMRHWNDMFNQEQ